MKETPMSQQSVSYWAVLRERGEHWDNSLPMRQQEDWDGHAVFMNALADEGVIYLGGPLGEGEQKFLLIFASESPQAIEARLAEDPWTRQKMLRVVSIERWEILLSAHQ